MKTTRTTKELLKIILDNIESYFCKDPIIDDGICVVVLSLFLNYEIIIKERFKLENYLRINLPPKMKNSGYCWHKGELEPRIKWLEEQIDKYEKGEEREKEEN